MRYALLIGVLLAGPAQAVAQDVAEPEDTAGAEILRQEVERRIEERVRVDLRLSDDQMSKLRATQSRIGPRRRLLLRQLIGYRIGLYGQMRPGVAANPDSVRVYMDGEQRVRVQQLALEQEEDREWAGYLTPVQRAQLKIIRQRIIDRVNQLRATRQNRLRGGDRPTPRLRPRDRGRPLR
jgi:hypothetical protein